MDHDDLFKEDESTVSPVLSDDFLHENEVRITQVGENDFRTPTKVVNSGMQEPKVGMIFKTNEEALKFYETYGVSKGFSVVTRSSRKNWTRCDLFTSMTFACSHYGSYNKKIDDNVPAENRRPNTSTMRGECEAQLNIVRDKNTHKWRISGFKDVHNHNFVSPSKTNFLSVNRKMPDVAKNMVEAFQRENLPVHKVTDILGGDVNEFNNRSCWNHLRDVRQKIYVGDAQWAYQYFQNRSLENPQFFYAIQCDGEGRAVNFFWVDARSRMSYKQFGDVVSFDTTYKTNKYGLPFAPFTGVNHNFQTIQFECALLQDETEESFIWLFETWKKAMGGVEPVSIITDSDAAMKAAIPKVFPNTRHRLCYWHIKKNFAANLRHLYFKKSPFKREMKECLKFTFRVEDFEDKWVAIVAKYNLETNTWLAGLYENRFAWVPVYNRTAFFAGMNSTGRSEGINAFFKENVRSSTSLMEFIEMYDKALKKLESNEREEDFKTEQTYRLLTTDSYLLRHAKGIYTRRAFEKFKRNWDRVEKYKSDVSSSDPIHVVKYKMGIDEHWLVKLCPQTFEGSCECHFFEFVGIPCAHLLKVFSKLDMVEIPKFFVMKRWLKGANKYRVIDNEECASKGRGNVMELSQLCHEATQVSCVAIKTKEGGKMYLDAIRELSDKINQLQLTEPDKEASPIILPCNDPPAVLLDPNVTKSKGRPTQEEKKKSAKDARFKHPIEEAQGKKRRICTGCDKPASHNRSTCPVRKAREDFFTPSGTAQNSSNKD